jgi:hypothetical protein
MHPWSFNGIGVSTLMGSLKNCKWFIVVRWLWPNWVNYSMSYALHQVLAVFVPGYVLKY